MAIGTLQAIINKFRRLTGSGTNSQISEDDIKDYINSFYLYDLPAQFRSLKLKDVYTFDTIRGVETYPFDSERYTTVESPCYCAKKEIKLFTDSWSFYSVYYNWQLFNTFAYGDGTPGGLSGSITAATQAVNCQITSANHGLTTGNIVLVSGVGGMTELNGNSYTITVVDSNNFLLNVDSTGFGVYTAGGLWQASSYQGTTQTFPIIRSSNNDPTNINYPASRVQNILITANTATGTVNVTDDGLGNLVGDCTAGVINYQTGVVSSLNFTSAIPSGNAIRIQYNPANVNMPLSILLFQNQFTLRPVPDMGYTIELVAYRQPTQALEAASENSGIPELIEWWELIAAGAAKKCYEDRLDPDGVALMDKLLFERYKVAEARTYAQLGSEAIRTMFTDQLTNNYGSGGYGFGSFM